MEKWRNGISSQPRSHPSFSSTLLDAIYRSIDETDSRGAPDRFSSKKQSTATTFSPPVSSSAPHLRPIRTTPAVRFRPEKPPDQFLPAGKAKKDRHGSIRSYLRSPASPGARLSNFLASLFAAKSKVSAELEPPCTRSCLSKTPSTVKRTVRFCPVSVIVGEDCRRRRENSVSPPPRRSKVVVEEEEEEDLFELKNLAAVGRFRDELPVYETTILGKCGGVSRGLVL